MGVRQFLVILCVFTSCRGSTNEPALTAYESFVTAIEAGDARTAYGLLSSQTKQKLEGALAEVSKAGGQELIDDAAWLTFASGVRPQSMKEVRLVEKQQDRAVISATVGGQLKTQQLVLEEGQWKVDWTSVLHP